MTDATYAVLQHALWFTFKIGLVAYPLFILAIALIENKLDPRGDYKRW